MGNTTPPLARELAALREREPYVLVLAGPNGAGKTTYYQLVLNSELHAPFVNADLIAGQLRDEGLASGGAYAAAQAAEARRRELLAQKKSF